MQFSPTGLSLTNRAKAKRDIKFAFTHSDKFSLQKLPTFLAMYSKRKSWEQEIIYIPSAFLYYIHNIDI